MKRIKTILPKNSGRSGGRVSVRHQGGRHKRYLRNIDFKRDKFGIHATVEAIEYDPNRNANLALLLYKDGERRYIIAPVKLEVGDKVVSDAKAPLKPGNAMEIGNILVGTQVHNIELTPGKGGQLVKGAGSVAVIHGKEENYVLVKLPSGEIRRIRPECRATVGQVGNADHRSRVVRKAGTKRHMGIRPSVRGVAQHPGSHPHGGGEGRTGVGKKYPKTSQGRKAVGKTRNKKKYSNKMIIKSRKPGKHSHR